MIFYNGFNLLIDIVLTGVVGSIYYRMGWKRGFGEGYSQSIEDFADWENDGGK